MLTPSARDTAIRADPVGCREDQWGCHRGHSCPKLSRESLGPRAAPPSVSFDGSVPSFPRAFGPGLFIRGQSAIRAGRLPAVTRGWWRYWPRVEGVMSTCAQCGSAAITDGHGRDGTRTDLCDVCYWRARYEASEKGMKKVQRRIRHRCGLAQLLIGCGGIDDAPCDPCPRRYIIDLQDKP